MNHFRGLFNKFLEHWTFEILLITCSSNVQKLRLYILGCLSLCHNVTPRCFCRKSTTLPNCINLLWRSTSSLVESLYVASPTSRVQTSLPSAHISSLASIRVSISPFCLLQYTVACFSMKAHINDVVLVLRSKISGGLGFIIDCLGLVSLRFQARLFGTVLRLQPNS